MTTGHLNEGQIQEILDNMVFEPGQPLALHLETCATCRERFEQYRRLYAGLAADPGFVLSPAFADSIIEKLPVYRPAFWARPAVRIFLALSACALVLAGIFIFVDMKPITAATIGIFKALIIAFRPLPVQFQQLFAKLNGNARLFILGGLGLLSAAFFDRILKRQILHHNS